MFTLIQHSTKNSCSVFYKTYVICKCPRVFKNNLWILFLFYLLIKFAIFRTINSFYWVNFSTHSLNTHDNFASFDGQKRNKFAIWYDMIKLVKWNGKAENRKTKGKTHYNRVDLIDQDNFIKYGYGKMVWLIYTDIYTAIQIIVSPKMYI